MKSADKHTLIVILALFAVLGCLLATKAEAHTTIIAPAGAAHDYQRWIDEAVVPTPAATLTVVEDASSCEGAAACTAEGAETIWVAGIQRQGFFHEVGHNFDYRMPAWARSRYLAILGRQGPWRQPGAPYGSAHELFAESYALCAFKLRIRRGGIIHGQEPVGGWRVHNPTCRLIQRLGAV